VDFHHVPVLLDEVIRGLNIKPDGIYVDCTLGGGGHAEEIAKRLSHKGILVGIEQDPEAFEAAKKRLAKVEASVRFVRDNFRNLVKIIEDLSIREADGFLADLGVSSYQLEKPERGFTYQRDAPLDMRMDPGSKVTAADIVNNYPRDELENILFQYGEEKWSKRIVSFIIERREKHPITTTGELVDIIKSAIPARARREGPHPAKRTFQALRIAVNDELGALEELLEGMVKLAAPGGRMCVISFHSLEDRLVKATFQKYAEGCQCPPDFPKCVCVKVPKLKIITKKPITATLKERSLNPRSRSAKLRIAEKLA